MALRRLRALAAVSTTVAVAACSSTSGGATAPDLPRIESRAATRAAMHPAVTKVLVISVDALNPRALRVLGPEGAPSFFRMRREGASTLNARTLVERTETLPNHTGMLTGRRVALPQGTGVTFNTDNGRTLRWSAGHYVAGVFDVVHDAGRRTAMFVAKDKFRFLNRSWNAAHGRPDTTGADDGRDKVDRFVYADAREDVLVDEVVAELRYRPRALTFLHLAAPDRAGHKYGGMTAPYLRAVRQTDRLLGRLLRTVHAHPALSAHLLVVLTADHGTNARSHRDPTKLANYRVPFFAWGPGVAKGADLYALNPERRRPGHARLPYDGRQPIRNADVANLVTDVLGLPRVPGSEFNARQRLDLS